MKLLKFLSLILIHIILSKGAECQLMLSPYLQAGLASEARNLARVRNLSSNFDIEMYSGYITVNDAYNASIFFWYFPPISVDPSNAPVVLWLEGGPGITTQLSVFTENGPFIVQEDMSVQLKNETWATSNHMIYIDSPAGVGLSFLNDPAGYDKNSNDTANATYEFLNQFFIMFPNLATNSFYVSGVSYGGHFVPALAYKIHSENQGSPVNRINLKGIVIESPFIDSRTQVYGYGDYLYYHGFIDEASRDHIDSEMTKVVNLIDENKLKEAQTLWQETFLPETSYFANATGCTVRTMYNYYLDVYNPFLALFEEFLALNSTREAIHVDQVPYWYANETVANNFADADDIMNSYKPLLEALIDAPEEYRVVLYSGQLDMWISFAGVENLIRNLNWSGKQEFNDQVRKKPWMVNGYSGGVGKSLKNFSYLLVRNAGHSISRDKTGMTLDIINRVTRGIPFDQ